MIDTSACFCMSGCLVLLLATLLSPGCSSRPQDAIGGVQPDYQGALNSVDCDAIIGWVWDRNRPNTPIRVDIYDGKTLLATVDADMERPVLVEKGRGNGKHGFRLATPARLKDGRPHTIGVRYAGTETDIDPPETLKCPSASTTPLAGDSQK
jgi:hypothetical protein